MSFDSLEKAIQQANVEISQVKQKAEKIVAEINQVVSVFLDEWATSIVTGSVKDHPEVVKELGSEKIGQLKKRLADITASFPNSAKERLAAIKWTHQTEFTQDEMDEIAGIKWIDQTEFTQDEIDANLAYDLSKKANESLDEVLREVIGQVGMLLIEYGVTKSGNEWQNKSGHLRYSYGIPDHIGFSAGIQLRDMRERYSKVIEEYIKAVKALRRAEKEKSIAEAKNLWDQS